MNYMNLVIDIDPKTVRIWSKTQAKMIGETEVNLHLVYFILISMC